jgi:hypothetical protein
MTTQLTHAAPSTPSGGAARRRRRVLLLLGAYTVLFLVMWLPPIFGVTGWLNLYPIFLLVWVPIEILSIVALGVALVSMARATNRRNRGESRIDVSTAVIAGLLALGSLPVLWFGGFLPI